MNGKDLIESMTHIDEKYIAEAEETPRRRHWPEILVSAACLALVLVGAWQFWPEQLIKEQAMDNNAPMVSSAQTGGTLEETAAHKDPFPAAARFQMAPSPVQMTVRVVEQVEGKLICVVVDPMASLPPPNGLYWKIRNNCNGLAHEREPAHLIFTFVSIGERTGRRCKW